MTTKWNPDLYNSKHSFVYDYGTSVIELLQPKYNESILDIGCGSGQLTNQINELAQEVVGIDFSPEMIEDAKTKFPTIDFQVQNAANFNMNKKFDAIFSNATLHWVLDYKGAIQSMFNHLKSDGRMAVEFGGKGNVQTIVNQLRNSLSSRGYQQQAETNQWYFPSIGEYTAALEAEGFHVTFAQHFERPTLLADNETGVRDWLSMFGKTFFIGVDEQDIEIIKNEVQEKIKPYCFKDGKWYTDYKRIRIEAKKFI